MKVLFPKYPGLLAICNGCGALLQYTPADIYGTVIYCPQCKATTEVPYNKGYDGFVKNPKTLEENAKES